jgi:hypothetical protein
VDDMERRNLGRRIGGGPRATRMRVANELGGRVVCCRDRRLPNSLMALSRAPPRRRSSSANAPRAASQVDIGLRKSAAGCPGIIADRSTCRPSPLNTPPGSFIREAPAIPRAPRAPGVLTAGALEVAVACGTVVVPPERFGAPSWSFLFRGGIIIRRPRARWQAAGLRGTLLVTAPLQPSQVEPWIGNLAHSIRERSHAEPAHHVLCSVGTSDAGAGMPGQRVVHIFADARPSQGVLEPVPK